MMTPVHPQERFSDHGTPLQESHRVVESLRRSIEQTQADIAAARIALQEAQEAIRRARRMGAYFAGLMRS